MTKLLLSFMLAALASSVAAQDTRKPNPATLFDPIGTVLTHPRCLNCHQVEAPHQTDAMIPHTQRIVRGADGHGAPTMQCSTCHQASNSADGKVPGVKDWHLAPLSMNWAGLSKAQICEQMKDPKRNGNHMTPEQVIEHMKSDPLVLWGWNPGGSRSTPVVSHADLVKALDAWALAGMPCPK